MELIRTRFRTADIRVDAIDYAYYSTYQQIAAGTCQLSDNTEMNQVVTITLVKDLKEILAILKAKLQELKTISPANIISQRLESKVEEVIEQKITECRYGVYKKEGFDVVCKLMNLSEVQLMSYREKETTRCERTGATMKLNLDFVTIQFYREDISCLWSFWRQQREQVFTGLHRLTIQLVVGKLGENAEVLQQISELIR